METAATEPKVVSLTPAVFHLPEKVNAVSREYGRNPIVPRGPKFGPLLARVRRGLTDALGCSDTHESILLTGTGSTAMAAVLGSCLRPDERLLVIRNGAYGDRILEFARTLGQPVVDMELPYGVRPDLGAVEAALAGVDAVAMVHGGTSTCTLNPIAEVGALARKHGKKLLMDGVSTLFVEPVELDAWGVAAVMGSCNKGLHGHPNMTCALVRKDLLADMERVAPRAPNLELWKTWRAQEGGAHPYTIDAMSVLQVEAALEALADEGGVAGRHGIYNQRATLLRAGYEQLGLEIARYEGQPLQAIGTMLRIPPGASYAALAERLATRVVRGRVFEIYSAQGKLSKDFFRLFHMGEYPLEAYEVFLEALGACIA
ncbi:MAG: alanine--glyoxylate aminotransferase family protein [Deltaproteobacteria bacterium]|nr:alanine--glyoxylate aminotransferase family protein [Deltaproteobacteria bacterium]